MIRKKLKSIDVIKGENPGRWEISDSEMHYRNFETDLRWIINDEMKGYFGDGNYYEFEKVLRDHDSYTHQYEEWFYHELWFDDEVVDFGINELDWEL